MFTNPRVCVGGNKRQMGSENGFALISGVVGLAIVTMGLWLLTMLLNTSQRLERGITSNAELTEMASTIELIVSTSQSCSKSGLIGLKFSTIDPPSSDPVEIHLPGSAGPGPLYAAADKMTGRTRSVTALKFTSLGLIGPGSGGTAYLGTLRLQTQLVGKAIAAKDSKEIQLALVLDGSNKVVDCYRTVPPLPPVPPPAGPTITVKSASMSKASVATCAGNINKSWDNWKGSVSCDAGSVATGGGGHCNVANINSISRPSGSNGWESGCCQTPNGAPGGTVYVVCLTP